MDKPADEEPIDVYKKYNAFKPADNKLKKHPCPDCFNCLFCSDARCKICLDKKSDCTCKKPSHDDQ